MFRPLYISIIDITFQTLLNNLKSYDNVGVLPLVLKKVNTTQYFEKNRQMDPIIKFPIIISHGRKFHVNKSIIYSQYILLLNLWLYLHTLHTE